ncbi:MAG: SDR family NAD(P)-dependent oxidoreductase [Lachnospiraceae bacterium]|nr:SDR family NAD(P)-dependent oxidoreductase [Lachnospiraceae bacterium]
MKTALVTGASRGIGRAIAAALAADGYNLHLICEKNVNLLSELKESLEKEHCISVKIYKADVSDYAALSEIFAGIKELDVLVNNAGISYVGLLSEMDIEDWTRIVSVNLNSVFYTSKLAIPIMLKKHSGSIINVSSVWGNVGASMEVAYSATKGGVNGFTRALAKELAPSRITVNAIACGFVDTDMNRNLSPDEVESVKEEIPANRLGVPEDISKAVMGILRSSDYLTGQVVTVDGGWT